MTAPFNYAVFIPSTPRRSSSSHFPHCSRAAELAHPQLQGNENGRKTPHHSHTKRYNSQFCSTAPACFSPPYPVPGLGLNQVFNIQGKKKTRGDSARSRLEAYGSRKEKEEISSPFASCIYWRAPRSTELCNLAPQAQPQLAAQHGPAQPSKSSHGSRSSS